MLFANKLQCCELRKEQLPSEKKLRSEVGQAAQLHDIHTIPLSSVMWLQTTVLFPKLQLFVLFSTE